MASSETNCSGSTLIIKAGKFAKLPVFNSKYYFQLSSESVAVTVEVSVPSSRRRRAAGGRKAALNQLNYQKVITGLIDALTVPSVLSVQGKRTFPANNVVTTSLQCRCNEHHDVAATL